MRRVIDGEFESDDEYDDGYGIDGEILEVYVIDDVDKNYC